MKQLFLFIMIAILPVSTLFAQSSKKLTKRPVIEVYAEDLDSLLFLAEKYLYADSALNSATASIQALRQAISEKTDIVTIQGEQLKNYLILIDGLKDTITNDRELAMIERAELRTTIRKQRKLIIGEGLGILLLLALILL
jgi:hypothetical protein